MSYRKTEEVEEILQTVERDKIAQDYERIRCPQCNWTPTASSCWMCLSCDAPEYFYDGCFTMWNTFDTRGMCPGCDHQWIWTSCLACNLWSRHEDWYVKNENLSYYQFIFNK